MNTAIVTALVGALAGGLVGYCSYILRKRDEKISTNTAILVEIQRLISVVKEHRGWWDSCVHNNDTHFPLIQFSTPIYDNLLNNIGIIDRMHIAQVVKFYNYLRFINLLQEKRPQYTNGREDIFDEQYLGVLNRLIRENEHSFNDAFKRYNLS